MNIGQILIIVGFVAIGIGVLVVAFVPDTSRGGEMINSNGIWLIIIGFLVFVARHWIRTANVVEESEFETIGKAIKDIKNTKSKTGKFKAVLWVIIVLGVLAFVFLI